MVSRSTFFAHRRQQIRDGAMAEHGSDADDDESETESDTDSAASLRKRTRAPPLVPFATGSAHAAEISRLSPERRSQQPGSTDFRSESVITNPESVMDADLEVEEVDDQLSTVQRTPDSPPSATPTEPGMSPPPPPSPSGTPEETPALDDIEEAIFSQFDIEDLLFAPHIEVEPWLKLGIVLLRWKSRKNISTHAYNELRKDLDGCLNIKVPSDRTIITHLQRITGLYPQKVDCCLNGCLAYVGRYRRAKKCQHCGQKRYQQDKDGDDDIPDIHLQDSDESDSATYPDDLDSLNQVSNSVNL
jgi:hypothetical protein